VSPTRRAIVADIAVASLAGLLALAVYIRSLAPGLLWGDSAEFQFAAWLGGFAHPTGYPLYLILGWLWSHIVPLGEPAYRMNLFSALWGGTATALLSLLVMRLLRFVDARAFGGPARIVALGAALAFALTPTFWSQAVVAEVYTLHACFVAAILLALLVWAERVYRDDVAGASQQLYIVALLFGLSLTHHRSTILLIPAIMLFMFGVLRQEADHPRPTLRQVLLLGAVVLAPLVLYLVIPLRAPHVPYYRTELAPGQSQPLYDSTVAGFFAHISGSIFSTSLVAPQARSLGLGDLVKRFVDELGPNGLILGILGLGWLLARGILRRDRRAWPLLSLTGIYFLAQITFNLFYGIGDIRVFYVPAYLVWVLWIAAGAWALGQAAASLIGNLGEGRRRVASFAGSGVALVVLLAFTYRSAVVYWPKASRANDNSAQRAWDALLAAELPQNAILVSNDRDEMAPLWYIQYVQGTRQDLTGLFPRLRQDAAWATVVRVTDLALETGRPVYLVKPMPGLDLEYDLASLGGEQVGPLGPPVEVRPPAKVEPDHDVDLTYGETVRLAGYDLAPETLTPGQPFQVVLYWEPLQLMGADWTSFVQIFNAEGAKLGQSDHRPGGDFYPSSLWAPGERLADRHAISLPAELGPGPYRLVAGLYIYPGEPLRHLGEPQLIGEIGAAK
jgi:hypothetical protein